MKRYEELKLEISVLDSSDVIATSGEVTTEQIKLPWQSAEASSYET